MTLVSTSPIVRSAIYELLSVAFLYPEHGSVEVLRDGASKLAQSSSLAGQPETVIALRDLSNVLAETDDASLEGEYSRIFGHTVAGDCTPYEGEYGQASIFQKSGVLADLSTFYGAFGMSLSPDLRDRLDHVSVEMEFMHFLTLKEAYAEANGDGEHNAQLCRDAQQSFLVNHLADWIMGFAKSLHKKTDGTGMFGGVASVLMTHMQQEFDQFKLDPTPLPMTVTPEPIDDYQNCDGPQPTDVLEEMMSR